MDIHERVIKGHYHRVKTCGQCENFDRKTNKCEKLDMTVDGSHVEGYKCK